MALVGAAYLNSQLAKAGALAVPALAAAGLEEMEKVMAESKTLVPVDLGVLRDSGTVLPPEVGPTTVEITAGYGGAASAYALVQHERLDFQHTVGQPKYLEQPFLEHTKDMAKALADGLEAQLERLG